MRSVLYKIEEIHGDECLIMVDFGRACILRQGGVFLKKAHGASSAEGGLLLLDSSFGMTLMQDSLWRRIKHMG